MKEFLKRISVIVALLLVLIVAVYAWFAMWDHANLQNMHLAVTDAGYIRVSEDGGTTWDNNLTLNLGEANVLGELSGNGLALYQPNYGMEGITDYRLYTEQELYIEKVFTFESDTAQSIYLTKNSFVAPTDLSDNFSAYGDYSRDYIAGAVRVGLYSLDESNTPQLIYIWAPNATYQFTGNTVQTNGVPEEAYTYQIGTQINQTATVETGGSPYGISADGDFVWGSVAQQSVKPVLTFNPQQGIAQQQKLMVRIWLEGADRECVRQLHNGKFRVYLDFNSNKEGTVNG